MIGNESGDVSFDSLYGAYETAGQKPAVFVWRVRELVNRLIKTSVSGKLMLTMIRAIAEFEIFKI